MHLAQSAQAFPAFALRLIEARQIGLSISSSVVLVENRFLLEDCIAQLRDGIEKRHAVLGEPRADVYDLPAVQVN